MPGTSAYDINRVVCAALTGPLSGGVPQPRATNLANCANGPASTSDTA